MAKTSLSRGGQCRYQAQLGDRAGGGDGGAAESSEVVTIGTGDTFDHADGQQATQLAREWLGENAGSKPSKSARRTPWMLNSGRCGAQQLLLGAFEEVQSLDRPIPLEDRAVKARLEGLLLEGLACGESRYALYERIRRLRESFLTLTDKLGQVYADVPVETAAAEIDAAVRHVRRRRRR